MSDWYDTTLGSVITLQRGHDLTEIDRSAGTVPVIGSAGPNGWHNVARAPGPGVTIGRSGASVGVVTYVPEAYWPHNTCLYVTDFKGNDPRFIAYLLRTMPLAEMNSGAAQPSLNRNFLYPLPVRLPGPTEQRRIASILSSYDDLIEVNRRRVATLEAMARGLFEEWYIRLRFPGYESRKIAETPDGPLPEGCGYVTFGELASEVRAAVSPADISPDTRYVGLEHIPRRSTTLDDNGHAGEVASLKLRFQRGDILFGKIRPYFHKVAWAPWDGVCSSDTIVFRPKGPDHKALCLVVASSDAFVALAVQTSNGTKMPRANPAVLRAHKVPIIPEEASKRFEDTVFPMIELAASLQAANEALSASRDLLLPRLMSNATSAGAEVCELEAVA
jgi:type I restriction enzyme, S subunit